MDYAGNDFEREQAEILDIIKSRERTKYLLKPGGTFLTQQVGHRNNGELNELLEKKLQGIIKEEHWDLEIATHQLQSAGFEILDMKEEFPKTMFRDIGAVVFYLKAIPWVIPDFNVQKYRKQLAELLLPRDVEKNLTLTCRSKSESRKWKSHRLLICGTEK